MQVGCAGEEEEYICLAYKKNRWVSFSHEASSAKEVNKTKQLTLNCSVLDVFLELRCELRHYFDVHHRLLVAGRVWSDSVEKGRFGQRFCFIKLCNGLTSDKIISQYRNRFMY